MAIIDDEHKMIMFGFATMPEHPTGQQPYSGASFRITAERVPGAPDIWSSAQLCVRSSWRSNNEAYVAEFLVDDVYLSCPGTNG